VAFKVINAFCTAALSENTVKPKITPNINNMSFILKTKNEDVLIPLTQSEQLWSHASFNPELPLVIVITGWNTDYNVTENAALDTLSAAYKCRGNVNFVAVDSAQYVDTLYTWSAFNTEAIGEIIAEGLEKLIKTYPIEKIHLIGHSLGAHIAGAAGRYLTYRTGLLVPRITGLDPANPCFNEGETLSGLSRGDATFVDVIHSDPGALGKRDSLGDADFYPNGLNPLPPGCLTIICAHARSWEYYAETVRPGNEQNFLGVKCRSLTALNRNDCPGKSYPMGYAVPFNLKGNYFLTTKANSPYGLNSNSALKQECAV